MLRAIEISQRYGAGPWLFQNLNLEVKAGEVIAVLGPNARGKTTLLKTLSGILEPAQGRVVRQGLIGYVPQSHQSHLAYPVIEMAIMGRAGRLRSYQNPTKKDREIALASLQRVGMSKHAERPFSQLSGGQKQLVLIARALAAQPVALVLDEPASALDLRNQALVMHVVKQLAEEGLGIVITTHDPGHAEFVADKVVLMDQDSLPIQGSAQSLLRSQELTQLYRTPIVVTQVGSEFAQQTVVVPDLYAGCQTRKNLQSQKESA